MLVIGYHAWLRVKPLSVLKLLGCIHIYEKSQPDTPSTLLHPATRISSVCIQEIHKVSSHIRSLMLDTEMVPKSLVPSDHLTWLMVEEYFIKFSHHESSNERKVELLVVYSCR
jgi:hypothetical protein